MIKFGIHSLDQLEKQSFKTFWGGQRFIAIDLYNQVINHPRVNEFQEAILLPFKDARGAYKRTYSARFDDFDNKVLELLKDNQPVKMLDLGVSDARTAADFFEKLQQKEHDSLTYYATDLSSDLRVLKDGKVRVILDVHGNYLQVVSPPFVLNRIRSESRLVYPFNFFIKKYLDHFVVKNVLRKYEQGEIKAEPMSLFCAKASDLAAKGEGFQLRSHNVLEPITFDQDFDIVRGMNLFNASYFTAEEFQRAFKNILDVLKEGGYFVMGSNQDAATQLNGAVFQKQNGEFKKVLESGQGVTLPNIEQYF